MNNTRTLLTKTVPRHRRIIGCPEVILRSARKVRFRQVRETRPAEAKFATVRYLAAPWIGYTFKTSSLPVAGLNCTGWRVSSEMGGGIIVECFVANGGITLQPAPAELKTRKGEINNCWAPPDTRTTPNLPTLFFRLHR
ncbi:MAG: hypothetical protein JWQ49_2023 [Edaphobacter sp.]|nr:hypothetical protein [Edaphobacter sp.]